MEKNATAIINSRAIKRLQQGHLWIYASDIIDTGGAMAGATVALMDEKGHYYGYAFYSNSSQISLRWCAPVGNPPDREFWRQRLLAAGECRRKVVSNTEAYRLVYGESDLIPSLLIDRYGDHFVLQTLSQGTDALKQVWVDLITELYHPASISERNDSPVRQHENLPLQKGVLSGTLPQVVVVQMNGIRFGIEILGGQKTGAFLDQRENYLAAASYTRGRVLDAFTFAGGFALHLASHADEVLAVDISEEACALARDNITLNGVANITVLRANVFDYLRELDRDGERFDTIVLDPPAFAKNKQSLLGASRGYKEINLRALRLLNAGGYLITNSCSFHMNEQLFLQLLAEAMADAGRPVRLIEQRTQGRDHPTLLGVPETKYLKCIILQVL